MMSWGRRLANLATGWHRNPTDDFPTEIRAERFESNPLIDANMVGAGGDNINGPSVIRSPGWLEKPLGRYYMYFAHHSGRYIRLAYADAPQGPWALHEPGALSLADATAFKGHIASPDVHVCDREKRIVMYFHGPAAEGKGQKTGIAHSRDGIGFAASQSILGNFYFRVWKWKGHYYAIAKRGNSGWCEICRSVDGVTPFTGNRDFLRGGRHVAVAIDGSTLLILYSRVGDAPERILACCVDLRGDWRSWRPSRPAEILRPTADYEGAQYPVRVSRPGPATGVRQLRDPCIFREGTDYYMYYSIAGEDGIAGAKLLLG